ncbi:YCF48-related protein [Parvicella tangerina]|uniref:Ycf48-like protein n=1 Tax=Parvicella tangerina TaxID=2829795 RepID=A0A916JJV9_9FLAO|nr:YCF48-related protein [Parvicella tangerina]CAG5076633.1 Ycf48-like protein [Parvicella tangerina]
MKNYLLLPLIFCSVLLTGQTNTWIKQATHPSTNTNTCIDFPNDSVGYLVNFSGNFCSTSDSGQHWMLESSITNKKLFGVDFLNDTIGYAVGEDGVIFKTTDGASWNQQTTSNSEDLYGVKVINDTVAFAVGRHHRILRTQNGGVTWSIAPVYESHSSAFLYTVDFVNDTLGFAVGKSNTYDGKLYRTTNGGDNWYSVGSFQWDILSDIYFINDSTYYLLGHTINTFPNTQLNIFKSSDYGAIWELSFEDYPGYIEVLSSLGPNKFSFNTDSTLFIAGTGGMIMKVNIEDSVLTMVPQSLGSVDFKDIFFIDEYTGYVVGVGGVIMQTQDGGETWDQINNGLGSAVRSIISLTENKAHSFGEQSAMCSTIDQGENWDVKKRGTYRIIDACFIDTLHGYRLQHYSSAYCYFMKTLDGGESWSYQSVPHGYLNTVVFTDSLNGYIAGDNGVVLKTIDGGDNWTDVSTPGPSKIRASYALSKDTVYFVGDNGLVVNTNDGGSSYNYYNIGVSVSMFDVFFWDADTGYVAGQLNTLLKTTDGGTNWTSVSPLNGSDITSMYFMDDQTGFVAGGTSATFSSGANTSGFVHKTTDGGATWETNQLTSTNGFNTIHFSPQGQGYVGGNNGYVAHAENFALAITHQENVQCTGPNTGSATVQAFNGTPPYNYTWLPSVSTSSSANGLAEGVYVVSVTDALGNTLSKRIVIEGPAEYNYTFESMNVCDSVLWEGTYYSVSGTYKDTILDGSGCDTIKSLSLTVGTSSSSTEAITVCDGYNWNGITYDTTGTYYDTLPNHSGCDSIMTLNLTVNKTFGNLSVNECYSYTSPSGSATYNTSGTYLDTITNSHGCDSIITIDLSINASYSNFSETVCDEYTSPSGQYNWTSTGNYMDTIPNAMGCDSVITVSLTVNNVDTSVIQSGVVLNAVSNTGNYQWADCLTGLSPIAGQNNQSFSPIADGEYALIISDNGCTDTSACYVVEGVGLGPLETTDLSIYPNPTYDYLHLVIPQQIEVSELIVLDATGRVVGTPDIETSNNSVQVSLPKESGVYFIKVVTTSPESVLLKCVKH